MSVRQCGCFAFAVVFFGFVAVAATTPSIPHSEKASAFAAQVYSSLATSHFNLFSTDIAGFDAVFSVAKDGQALGKMNVRWNRGDDKVTARLEPRAEAQIQSAAEGLIGDHVLSLLVWGPFKSALGSEAGVYAAKSDSQYVMDITEKSSKKYPEITSHFLFALDDFSWLRNRIVRKDGTLLDMTYVAEAAGGKQFVRTTSTTGRPPGKTSWKVEATFTYTHANGTVFVKRAVITRTAGNKTTAWIATLDSVAFQKGAATPGPEDVGDQPKDSPTEGLRDRFWGEN